MVILLLIIINFSLRSYSSSPAGAVLVTSSDEDDHPEESHDEAEDGDKHHPAQRVRWIHVGRRHQDPNQPTKHLQRKRCYYGF